MRTSDFEFHLPPGRIAAEPAPERDASRLLALNRVTGATAHLRFSDLPSLLRPGDCLVVNDSRVIPARLRGRRERGGSAEALLLHPEGDDGAWRALVKPGKKLPAGSAILIGDAEDPDAGRLVVERDAGEGERIVRLESSMSLDALLDRFGRVPLPPYIESARRSTVRAGVRAAIRAGEDAEFALAEAAEEAGDPDAAAEREARDRARYQTVYAREPGSVAAPTAGLHFTEELLARVRAMGAEVRRVTLHVGPGTFAPVKVEDPREHAMHAERWSVAAEDAEAIEAARRDPARRVVAIGTTSVRVLETIAREGAIRAGSGSTDLRILPGHEFRAVDAMVTNFHLPRSTLLMLVAAFAGRENVLAAYEEAVREGYRFYSYGDAMFVG